MAYNHHTSALLLISLLLFAAANPSAHAATLNGLTVAGRLCCTSFGNCPGQGVGGVSVLLNCNILGLTSTVGRTITDATGAFNITIPTVTGLVLGLPTIPCVVAVHLPLEAAVCPLLATTTGLLTSAVQSVGTVVTAALGLVESAVCVGFTLHV